MVKKQTERLPRDLAKRLARLVMRLHAGNFRAEWHSFSHAELPELPEDYCAVVRVEIRPLDLSEGERLFYRARISHQDALGATKTEKR